MFLGNHVLLAEGIVTWQGDIIPGRGRLLWQLLIRHSTGLFAFGSLLCMIALILHGNVATGLFMGYVAFYFAQCNAALNILHQTGVYHSHSGGSHVRLLAIMVPLDLYLVALLLQGRRLVDELIVAYPLILFILLIVSIALLWDKLVGARYDACCKSRT